MMARKSARQRIKRALQEKPLEDRFSEIVNKPPPDLIIRGPPLQPELELPPPKRRKEASSVQKKRMLRDDLIQAEQEAIEQQELHADDGQQMHEEG